MPDNNAPAPVIKALVVANPGDPITAGRWNEMQCQLRSEHVQHAHTGTWKGELYDGAPIAAAGLADNAVITSRIADRAVTGDKVDPTTSVTVRDLTATGKLKATTLELTEATAIAVPAHDLKFGHSTRHGSAAGRALADLARVDGDRDVLGINLDGDWKDGVKICSDLQITGKTTLGGELIANTTTVNGALTAKSSASITGALTVGNGLTVSGSALTAKNGAALSGTVTASNGLAVSGALLTASSGLTVSGALLTASSGLAVSGSFTAANGLAVSGAALTAASGLTVSGAALTATSGLTVTGSSTFANDVTLNGNVKATSGTLSVSSGLYVGGNSSLQGTLVVKGRHAATAEGGDAARMVHGYVSADLSQTSGSGYSVEHNDNGFRVRFSRAFKSFPTIIVQQHGNGSTLDNALVVNVYPGEFQVYTGNSSGSRERRSFFFLAIGPSAD